MALLATDVANTAAQINTQVATINAAAAAYSRLAAAQHLAATAGKTTTAAQATAAQALTALAVSLGNTNTASKGFDRSLSNLATPLNQSVKNTTAAAQSAAAMAASFSGAGIAARKTAKEGMAPLTAATETAGKAFNSFLFKITGLQTTLGVFILRIAAINAVWTIWAKTINTVGAAIGNIVKFDQGLKNIQAITVATATDIERVGIALRALAIRTPFSPAELADAFTLLGQAGFTTAESLEAINAVAAISIGTLTSTQETVKLLTSVIRAFNVESTKSSEVANVLVAAVNKSKLTIEGLNTAFNFAGPAAAAAGLTYQETAAALGTLADQGIRFSTQGTGLRQVLAALISPSDRFRKELEAAGIAVEDVNPLLNDFGEILLLLRDRGFGAAGAIAGLEKRTAGALLAFINGARVFNDLRDGITDTNAAILAMETQMTGLEKIAERLNQRFLDLFNSVGARNFFADFLNGLEITIDALEALGSALSNAFTSIDGDARPTRGFFEETAKQFREVALAVDDTVLIFRRATEVLKIYLDSFKAATFFSITESINNISKAFRSVGEAIRGSIPEFRDFRVIFSDVSIAASSFGNSVLDVINSLSFGKQVIDAFKNSLSEIGNILSNLPTSGFITFIEKIVNLFPERAALRYANALSEVNKEQEKLTRLSVALKPHPLADLIPGNVFVKLLTQSTERSREFFGISKSITRVLTENRDALRDLDREFKPFLDNLAGSVTKSDQLEGSISRLEDAQERVAKASQEGGKVLTSALVEQENAFKNLRNIVEQIDPIVLRNVRSFGDLIDVAKALNEETRSSIEGFRDRLKQAIEFIDLEIEVLKQEAQAHKEGSQALALIEAAILQATIKRKTYIAFLDETVRKSEQTAKSTNEVVKEFRALAKELGDSEEVVSQLNLQNEFLIEQEGRLRDEVESHKEEVAALNSIEEKSVEQAKQLIEAKKKQAEAENKLSETQAIRIGVVQSLEEADKRAEQARRDRVKLIQEELDLLREKNEVTDEELRINKEATELDLAKIRARGQLANTSTVLAEIDRVRISQLKVLETLENKLNDLILEREEVEKRLSGENAADTKKRLEGIDGIIKETERKIQTTLHEIELGKQARIIAKDREEDAETAKTIADEEARFNGELRETIEALREAERAERFRLQIALDRLAIEAQLHPDREEEFRKAALQLEIDSNTRLLTLFRSMSVEKLSQLEAEIAISIATRERQGATEEELKGLRDILAVTRQVRKEAQTQAEEYEVINDTLDEESKKLTVLNEKLVSISRTLKEDIVDALTEFIFETQNVGDLFESIGDSIIESFKRAFRESLAEKLKFDNIFKGNILDLANFAESVFGENGLFGNLGRIFSGGTGATGFAQGEGAGIPSTGGGIFGLGGAAGGAGGAQTGTFGAALGGIFPALAAFFLGRSLFGKGTVGTGASAGLAAGVFANTALGSAFFAPFLTSIVTSIASSIGAAIGSAAASAAIKSAMLAAINPLIGVIVGVIVALIVTLFQKDSLTLEFLKGAQRIVEPIFRRAGVNLDIRPRSSGGVRGALTDLGVTGPGFDDRKFPRFSGADVIPRLQRNVAETTPLTAEQVERLTKVLFAFGLVLTKSGKSGKAFSDAMALVAVVLLDLKNNGEALKNLDIDILIEELGDKLASFRFVVEAINDAIERFQGFEQLSADDIFAIEQAIEGAAIIFADTFPKSMDISSKAIRNFRKNGTIDIEELEDEIAEMFANIKKAAGEIAGEAIKITLETGDVDASFEQFEQDFDKFIKETVTNAFLEAFTSIVAQQGFITPLIDGISELFANFDPATDNIDAFRVALRDLVLAAVPGFELMRDALDEIFQALALTLGLPLEKLPNFFGGKETFLDFDSSTESVKNFLEIFTAFTKVAENFSSNAAALDFITNDATQRRVLGDIAATQPAIKAANERHNQLAAILRGEFARLTHAAVSTRGLQANNIQVELLDDPAAVLLNQDNIPPNKEAANIRFRVGSRNHEGVGFLDGNLAQGLKFAVTIHTLGGIREGFAGASSTKTVLQLEQQGFNIEESIELTRQAESFRQRRTEIFKTIEEQTGITEEQFREKFRELKQEGILPRDLKFEDLNLDQLLVVLEAFGPELAARASELRRDLRKAAREIKRGIKELVENVGTADEFVATFAIIRQAFAEGILNAEEALRLTNQLIDTFQEELPAAINLREIFDAALKDGVLDVDKFRQLLEDAAASIAAVGEASKSAILQVLQSGDLKAGVTTFTNFMKKTIGDALIDAFTNAIVNQVILKALAPFITDIGKLAEDALKGKIGVGDIEKFVREKAPEVVAAIEGAGDILEPILELIFKLFEDTGLLDAYNSTLDRQESIINDQLAIAERWQSILDSTRQLRADLEFGPGSPQNVQAQIAAARQVLNRELGRFRDQTLPVEERQEAAERLLAVIGDLQRLGVEAGEIGLSDFQAGSVGFQRFTRELLSILDEVEAAALEGASQIEVLKAQTDILRQIEENTRKEEKPPTPPPINRTKAGSIFEVAEAAKERGLQDVRDDLIRFAFGKETTQSLATIAQKLLGVGLEGFAQQILQLASGQKILDVFRPQEEEADEEQRDESVVATENNTEATKEHTTATQENTTATTAETTATQENTLATIELRDVMQSLILPEFMLLREALEGSINSFADVSELVAPDKFVEFFDKIANLDITSLSQLVEAEILLSGVLTQLLAVLTENADLTAPVPDDKKIDEGDKLSDVPLNFQTTVNVNVEGGEAIAEEISKEVATEFVRQIRFGSIGAEIRKVRGAKR